VITESLRFIHPYNQPGRTLVVTRTDGNITLTLEGAADVAPITMPACKVMDEITPTATAYVWCVWIDETPVRIGEGDARAIQRLVERSIASEPPAI
jgi:hypothetical protein